MSKFPWWDTPITLYNKLEDTQTQVITWYRHTISNCFWSTTGGHVSINNVVLDTDAIIVRIPKDSRFMERYDWEQLPNDRISNYFTLGAGDIIIKGEVTDTINEYLTGHRSSDLIEKYKTRCMIIDRYNNNTGTGRGQPHYHVTGK